MCVACCVNCCLPSSHPPCPMASCLPCSYCCHPITPSEQQLKCYHLQPLQLVLIHSNSGQLLDGSQATACSRNLYQLLFMLSLCMHCEAHYITYKSLEQLLGACMHPPPAAGLCSMACKLQYAAGPAMMLICTAGPHYNSTDS